LKLWIDFKLHTTFVVSSSIGFKAANSESNHLLKVIDYGSGKVFNTTSSVSQSGINDNNYSFDIYGTYTKSVGEDHKFVGVIGNTIYKEYGNGLFVLDRLLTFNNSWDYANVRWQVLLHQGQFL
jgi:hypothetical protein